MLGALHDIGIVTVTAHCRAFRSPVAVEKSVTCLDTAKQRLAKLQTIPRPFGAVVGKHCPRHAGLTCVVQRARHGLHARGTSDAFVFEGRERLSDLRQEFLRLVAGVVHQAFEGYVCEVRSLLDLEVLRDVIHKDYLEILEKEITKAFVYSYQEQAETLFQNYLDHAEAYVNKSKVKDRNTKEELAPDEGFMKSIEEQSAIIGSAADGFRQEVIAYLWAANRRGEKIDYRSYEPLKEAIEKKLVTSVRDLSRVITKSRMRDEEQSEKYNAMVKNLLEHGYCPSCVDMVLKYAANNLWKD